MLYLLVIISNSIQIKIQIPFLKDCFAFSSPKWQFKDVEGSTISLLHLTEGEGFSLRSRIDTLSVSGLLGECI